MIVTKIVLSGGRMIEDSIEMFRTEVHSSIADEALKKAKEGYVFFEISESDSSTIYQFIVIKPSGIKDLLHHFIPDYIIATEEIADDTIRGNFSIISKKMTGRSLSLIAAENIKLDDIEQIITSNPDFISYYVRKKLINLSLKNIYINVASHSLEIYPLLNNTTAIIDVVETGKSLKRHNLVKIMDILPNIPLCLFERN
jgi:hypothetical protein